MARNSTAPRESRPRSLSLLSVVTSKIPDGHTRHPQNRPFFHLRCSGSTQEDFRLPIAHISPDFFRQRRKSNPAPILPIKSPYCTVFSEFPGFSGRRNIPVFRNRAEWAPFGKKRPFWKWGEHGREVLPQHYFSDVRFDGGWEKGGQGSLTFPVRILVHRSLL